MRFITVNRPQRRLYRIVGGLQEFTITLTDGFWSEGLAIADAAGGVQTELDANIEAVCNELKYALYYVAINESTRH